MSDLHWMTATEAARAITARKLSPVELMKALLERITRLDPKLNVFIRFDGDAAMDAAKAEVALGPPAWFKCLQLTASGAMLTQSAGPSRGRAQPPISAQPRHLGRTVERPHARIQPIADRDAARVPRAALSGLPK
jgi:hypothetical protein